MIPIGKREVLTKSRQLRLLMWRNHKIVIHKYRAVIVFVVAPFIGSLTLLLARYFIERSYIPNKIYKPIAGDELMNYTL